MLRRSLQRFFHQSTDQSFWNLELLSDINVESMRFLGGSDDCFDFVGRQVLPVPLLELPAHRFVLIALFPDAPFRLAFDIVLPPGSFVTPSLSTRLFDELFFWVCICLLSGSIIDCLPQSHATLSPCSQVLLWHSVLLNFQWPVLTVEVRRLEYWVPSVGIDDWHVGNSLALVDYVGSHRPFSLKAGFEAIGRNQSRPGQKPVFG